MYWLTDSTNSAFSFYLLHLPYQPLTLSIEVSKIRVAGTHMSQLLSATSKTALYISLKCFPLCYFTIFLKNCDRKKSSNFPYKTSEKTCIKGTLHLPRHWRIYPILYSTSKFIYWYLVPLKWMHASNNVTHVGCLCLFLSSIKVI